jgi:acetoin utilization protein AcuB
MPSKMEMAVGDVMTASPVAVGLKDELVMAQEIMRGKNIRHLPVVDGGKPVGVISAREIDLALIASSNTEHVAKLLIEDIYVQNPYMVELDTNLSEVVSYMAEHSIGSVVVTRDGELDGIFTATDACKYLALCIQGAFSTD